MKKLIALVIGVTLLGVYALSVSAMSRDAAGCDTIPDKNKNVAFLAYCYYGDSWKNVRHDLAKKAGIKDYRGTAKQNMIIKNMILKELEAPVSIPETTTPQPTITLDNTPGYLMKNTDGQVMITDELKKLEASTWMYGDYMVGGFAIKVGSLPQDQATLFPSLVGKKVIITGKVMSGYPINPGEPYYIEMTAVEEDSVAEANKMIR